MDDIKLIPLQNNEFIRDKIHMINESLNYLKKYSPLIVEEVRTAELIIENIEAKLFSKNQKNNKKYT